MNDYDSSRIVAVLNEACGLRLVANPEDADVILMNTCSVREKAEEKVYSELGRFQRLKENNPDLIIGVGGCVAQQEGERIQKRAPYVDVVFGPQTYHRLPDIVKDIRRERLRTAVIDMPAIEKFDYLPQPKAEGVKAFVTIMEGCDKFCSFCVVPYTRGREHSRPVSDVLRECRQLLAQGVVEITLLGQNVNAYRGAGPDGHVWDFARLLHAVADLHELKRLRFTTSHPIEMTDSLIRAFAEIPCLMPYLHLPVQSGSDRILKKMRRRHTRSDYLRIIDSLRTSCPHIALSSDFIVGFPGETDADFFDTMELVRQLRFDASFAFKYSPRPGTPATKYGDDVPESVKDARLQELLALLRAQTRDALVARVGTTVEVLVERRGRGTADMLGRTRDFKLVHFEGDSAQVGHLVNVRITRAYGQSLRGSMALAN